MTSLSGFFLFLLGLCVGSFLNVCIYRMPRGGSVLTPPSSCPACGRVLRWFENVPLAGWVLLGGRCRTCRARISAVYPAIELATGALFVLHYAVLGLQPLLALRLAFACAMLVLFVIDLQHQLLPNSITLPGIAIGFAASLFLPPGWQSSLLGIALGGGVLLALIETWLRVRGVEAMGMGDVKMLAMIGAFLGWRLMVLTLVVSSLVGSLVGVALMAARRGTLMTKLPYGTFLAAAALLASLGGEQIITWYTGFYR